MSEKNKNESNAKNVFDQCVKKSKQKAISENMKQAVKSSNILMQTIDTVGNLIGINNTTRELGPVRLAFF